MGWGPSPFGWLPSGLNEEQGFRLDVVSLLAILGESTIAEQTQPLTASWLCLLPRLLPAPQVLLKPSRPFRLPDYKAKVVGVKGGTIMETLNYFPNILHPLDQLPPLEFQVYRIKHRPENETRNPSDGHGGFRLSRLTNKGRRVQNHDDESHDAPIRQSTQQRVVQRATLAENAGQQNKRLVPVQKFSPLKILDVASFILTLVILGICIWNRDGIAIIALGTLSTISSIVGYASKWTPALTHRSSIAQTPRGDVMIRSREGGFILVLCEEEVARELYFGNEQCVYQLQNTVLYRFLVGLATVMLMSSVILLGNCKFYQQAAIGGSYLLLNFLYWMVALAPKRRLWDLSRYECRNLEQDQDLVALKAKDKKNSTPTYTRALWYAIYASQCTEWCSRTDATPKTEVWKKWLEEADAAAREDRKDWDPREALNFLLETSTRSSTTLLQQSLAEERDEGGHGEVGGTVDVPVAGGQEYAAANGH